MSRHPPASRDQFRWFHTITTRWMDNDAYGHVNNVVYYSWIDTAVNRFLLDHGLLDLAGSPVVGIVAETGCRYISQVSYPDEVCVGIRVAKLGKSSVRYEVGVFRAAETLASAEGHFVHVYVDRATMRPVAIPDAVRAGLETIHVPA
ncbi:Acyl-CoA thioesterase [Rhodovastum atsumiense]|uniref:Acyl-CoA thioesterase n=1 Tax=Rhodovastum atsumiense TaxID=504468 RepID=A0A5M6IX95_9PROT|nr:thioesterase family protein [Rhodovastum atsumiense]KAA5612943.1 acyl-CoA thioesterase [Rhodovastum atsumiense]CAH2600967.1 Acyl-CoA thioesterase [Rhodovastum atsumiense]